MRDGTASMHSYTYILQITNSEALSVVLLSLSCTQGNHGVLPDGCQKEQPFPTSRGAGRDGSLQAAGGNKLQHGPRKAAT